MKNKIKFNERMVLNILFFILFYTPIFQVDAATMAGPLTITKIRTGWNSDNFAIETDQPIVNPAGCTTPDGYIFDPSKPGHKTYYPAVFMAFASSKKVLVTVSDTECYLGRPRIWGINVEK